MSYWKFITISIYYCDGIHISYFVKVIFEFLFVIAINVFSIETQVMENISEFWKKNSLSDFFDYFELWSSYPRMEFLQHYYYYCYYLFYCILLLNIQLGAPFKQAPCTLAQLTHVVVTALSKWLTTHLDESNRTSVIKTSYKLPLRYIYFLNCKETFQKPVDFLYHFCFKRKASHPQVFLFFCTVQSYPPVWCTWHKHW